MVKAEDKEQGLSGILEVSNNVLRLDHIATETVLRV